MLALSLCGLSAMTSGRASAANVPDAWITLRTKIALVTDDHLPADAVHVDTLNGLVTLYGKVDTDAQRQLAAATAKGMKGATGVRDLLQVVPPARESAVRESDDRVKLRLEAALRADESSRDSNVSVKSVDKGAVLLAGTARTLSAHLRAVEVASAVPGVRSVATEIRAPEELTESEISRVAEGAKDAARDSWTTADVKLRLLADAEVPALDVSVETTRGVVVLFGQVPSTGVKLAAEGDARKVGAAVSVVDEIQVVPASHRKAIAAEDGVLKGNIEAAFKGCPELTQVDVAVRDGRAHLTGAVASGWDRLRAVSTARAIEGVRSVDDELHLSRSK